MNENQSNQEKDFRSLIGQFTSYSETRDKMISEIDGILDRIKQNRRPSADASTKDPSSPLVNEPPVMDQLNELVRKIDLSNEKLSAIINRLNELV